MAYVSVTVVAYQFSGEILCFGADRFGAYPYHYDLRYTFSRVHILC